MLQTQAALRTWALESEPNAEGMIVAEALPDHRLAYLDYEGPISGGRGSVTRWDAGDYQVMEETPSRLRFVLRGTRLRGEACLESERRPDVHGRQRWKFSLSSYLMYEA